jgi:uncharacterized protein (DUF1697 family)
MTTFKIPTTFVPGFQKLIELSEEEVKQIAGVVKTIPVGTGPTTFQEQLSQKLELTGLNPVATTIFSFGSLLYGHKDENDQLAEKLAESFGETTDLKEDELNDLTGKLKIILSHSENLKISFKAFDLLSENSAIFRDCKIVSDIRLLFQDDLSEKNKNAIVIHQLGIEFQEDDEVKKSFYSFSRSELEKLKAQIERAIEKEESIRQNFANIEFLNLTE